VNKNRNEKKPKHKKAEESRKVVKK